MTGEALDLTGSNLEADEKALRIGNMWDKWDGDRGAWKQEILEAQRYTFATDVRQTDGDTGWNNSTVIPKLAHIRDTLLANYETGLFPNQAWLQWVASDKAPRLQSKKKAIEAYMVAKTDRKEFRNTMNQLLSDYVDFGIPIATTGYEHLIGKDQDDEDFTVFSGPVVKRLHPFDVVFNPLAESIEKTPVIIRSVMSIGDMEVQAENSQDQGMIQAVARAKQLRNAAGGGNNSRTVMSAEKWTNLHVAGFSSYSAYLGSGMVELLTFMGDYYDADTMTTMHNVKMVVMDRMFLVVEKPITSWVGRKIYMAGWRNTPMSLMPQSPLANLVGMQYRINHLENLKADALDLTVFPPVKIKGQVAHFNWGPMEPIHLTSAGDDVELLNPNAAAISVDVELQFLMDQMEMFAGAPRETLGIRTPGEKTAAEFMGLMSAAGRNFQKALTNFEINVLEPVLNAMLYEARARLVTAETISSINEANGKQAFVTVTNDDLKVSGRLRPIGARHFSRQQQILQDLMIVTNGPLKEKIMPHMSGVALTGMIEDAMNVERFELFKPWAGVDEAQELASRMQEAQQEVRLNAATPLREEDQNL
jgi:hypothetical protein